MDRTQRIEEFLKLVASAKNDGMAIDSNVVYSNLIYLGIDNKREGISDYFDKWIYDFENIKNISVFVDPGWSYFCQFINSNYKMSDHSKDIKLYIPLDRQHIYNGAKELFQFLAEEDIPHVSKIGSRVRFDDIVIRTDSPENANKIIAFVHNNQYIREGLLLENPFALNDNNIAMAWDNKLSYNSVVSDWISDYVNWEYENNNINNVSYLRFYAYVQEKSKTLFEEGNGLREYADKLEDKGVANKYGGSIDAGLVNYYDVTKLFLMSLDPKMEKEKLFDFIKIVSDSKNQKASIARMCYLRCFHKKQQDNMDEKNVKKVFSEQQREAFKLSYDYMCEKYGKKATDEHFLQFINTGAYVCITRYRGARQLLSSNHITQDEALTISTYWRCEGIHNAIITTFNKYGYNQAFAALNHLISFGDYTRFTNDYNSRSDLIKRCQGSNVLENIKFVLQNEGYDVPTDVSSITQMYVDHVIQGSKKVSMHM